MLQQFGIYASTENFFGQFFILCSKNFHFMVEDFHFMVEPTKS